MKLFRDDNTNGYSSEQLDALNEEWAAIVNEMGLEEFTEEYNVQASRFADEVSRP
jgi:hypothetical protein